MVYVVGLITFVTSYLSFAYIAGRQNIQEGMSWAFTVAWFAAAATISLMLYPYLDKTMPESWVPACWFVGLTIAGVFFTTAIALCLIIAELVSRGIRRCYDAIYALGRRSAK